MQRLRDATAAGGFGRFRRRSWGTDAFPTADEFTADAHGDRGKGEGRRGRGGKGERSEKAEIGKIGKFFNQSVSSSSLPSPAY